MIGVLSFIVLAGVSVGVLGIVLSKKYLCNHVTSAGAENVALNIPTGEVEDVTEWNSHTTDINPSSGGYIYMYIL